MTLVGKERDERKVLEDQRKFLEEFEKRWLVEEKQKKIIGEVERR